MDLSQDEILTRKRHLQQIKKDMPEIWDLLASARCCPSYIGLSACCSMDAVCSECWEKAITIENPVLVKDGKYYCPECNTELSLKKTENGSQEWFCSKCNRTIIVPTATIVNS